MICVNFHGLAENISDDLADLGVFVLQDPGTPSENGDIRAHRRQEVAVLTCDIARANYDQAFGGSSMLSRVTLSR